LPALSLVGLSGIVELDWSVDLRVVCELHPCVFNIMRWICVLLMLQKHIQKVSRNETCIDKDAHESCKNM
jgi:hypothetical protein